MNRIVLFIVMTLGLAAARTQTADTLCWREIFADSNLAALIDTALVHNADLRTASLNVVQNEASLRAARLSLLPTVSIGADGSLSKPLSGKSTEYTYTIPVSMGWEVNLAGRFCAEKRAAEATLWSSAESERAVRIQIIASVANHFYTIVALYEQLAITRQSVATSHKTVEVMEALKDAGLQNEAAVSLARAAWLNSAASEISIQQQIKSTENALSLIVGSDTGHVRQRLRMCGFADSDNPTFEYDVRVACDRSYELRDLSSRPDVKAAEYALAAQVAQVSVARSAFYPTLTLSASLGWTNNIGQIVNPPQMLLNTLVSLLQPIFNQTRNTANLRIAKAQREQALVRFNQALLEACTELSDALDACRFSAERLTLREQEVVASKEAYETSTALMQYGSATYLEVLTAQASYLTSQLALVSDKLDQAQARINLYKATGGGL